MRHVPAPTLVPVPGGKRIEEYAGRLATGDDAVSVARMVAPAGWSEPAQRPAFDEITVVLRGVLAIEHEGGELEVSAGQAVITRAGERIRYRVAGTEPAEYVAVCVPAFAADLAGRDPS